MGSAIDAFAKKAGITPVKAGTTKKAIPTNSNINAFAAGIFQPVPPTTNKGGMDISDHPFNPLNPNNQNNAPAPTQSVFKNFVSSLIPSAKKVASYLGFQAAQIVAPGITHDELHDPEFLKNTVEAIPGAAYQVGKEIVTHPINTVDNATLAAAHGLSDIITNGIINTTVPKADREGTKAAVQEILDKYLSPTPQNKTQEAIQQGFTAAGSSAPFVAAGGITGDAVGSLVGKYLGRLAGDSGEVLGSQFGEGGAAAGRDVGTKAGINLGNKIGESVGNPAGFIAAGQTQVDREATIKERSTRLMSDLVGLGLFTVGSTAFHAVLPRAVAAITDSVNALKSKPESEPELPTESQPTQTPPVRTRDYRIQDFGQPESPTKPVEPITGTGEMKTRGLSAGVEANAVAKKLTSSLGDLPEYKTIDMKEQAAAATDLLKQNPDQAKRIALGQEPPPTHLLPESVFVAVEADAVKNGDVATLRDLATSSLTGEATTMGQRIRTLAERDPESPVTAIQDLARTREQAAKVKDLPKAKREITDNIKQEIKKTAPSKETWSDFVNSLKC